MRLKRTAATTLALVTLAVAGLLTAGSPAQAATPAYLFTVQAVAGSTTPGHSATGEDERFTLTLRGVDPVTKFADRPFRAASVMSPAALVSNWNAWFADSSPNAVLTFARTSGKAPQSIVVTLTRPRYNSAGSTLTFTATRTYRTLDPSQKGKDWQRPATPHTFTSASLFIDDAGSSVTDGITASLQQAMQQYVFSPNNAATWAAVQAALVSILTQDWQQGKLMGPTASQAFTVNCQTFTAQQILNGFLNCSVTMHVADGTTFSTTLSQQQAN
ncbi:MAG: hypothetical protein WCG77_07805 [Actinomycetes bacterium]|jgi:hypothetical protein